MIRPSQEQIEDQIFHVQTLGLWVDSWSLCLFPVSKLHFNEGIKHPPNNLVIAIQKGKQIPPIVVKVKDGLNSIIDGHNRASAALETNVKKLWTLFVKIKTKR